MATTGWPFLLSTGMSPLAEIDVMAVHCHQIDGELAGVGPGLPGFSVALKQPPNVAPAGRGPGPIGGVEARPHARPPPTPGAPLPEHRHVRLTGQGTIPDVEHAYETAKGLINTREHPELSTFLQKPLSASAGGESHQQGSPYPPRPHTN